MQARLPAASGACRAAGRIPGSRAAFSASRPQQRGRGGLRAAGAAGEQTRTTLELPRKGHMLISKTEVPSFIQRDDMMDQLYRWALIEAGEGGLRNFGMPMKVAPQYYKDTLWGFDVEILKEGVRKADLGINFDADIALKHEWVGRDAETGMPRMEGTAEEVPGKDLEIWWARLAGGVPGRGRARAGAAAAAAAVRPRRPPPEARAHARGSGGGACAARPRRGPRARTPRAGS
jgi:hypothetical protein